jgi:hypothetical protein
VITGRPGCVGVRLVGGDPRHRRGPRQQRAIRHGARGGAGVADAALPGVRL